MVPVWKQSLGRWGEDLAASYLQKHGFTILAHNKHIGHAEVDLLAQKENMLVFVEVKTRSSSDFGQPEEAVDERKLTHLIEAAERFSIEECSDLPWRIDVIAITGSPKANTEPEILWYENVSC
ncbi:MAG: YraN family protein [Anaerolineae bacterium]|jgi:putative endonuclease|nr:YraN family protein [Anaerolineae bacterium]